MKFSDDKVKEAYKYIQSIVHSDDFVLDYTLEEQEEIKTQFKNIMSQVEEHRQQSSRAEIQKLLSEDAKKAELDQQIERSRRGSGLNTVASIVRGFAQLPPAAANLGAHVSQLIGKDDVAESLAQYAADKNYDIQQALPGATSDDNILQRVLEAVGENTPLMVAAGGGTRGLLAGASALGVQAPRALKAIEVAGTAAGFSIPDLQSQATGIDDMGRVSLPKNPLAVTLGAIPHAAIETTLGVSPASLMGVVEKGLFTKGFTKLVSRYQRRYGNKAAAALVAKELFSNSAQEGMEEVIQGPIGVITKHLANSDVETALNNSFAEMASLGYLKQLGEDFKIGAGTGLVYSGASAIRSSINDSINDKKTSIAEKQQLAKNKELLVKELTPTDAGVAIVPDGLPAGAEIIDDGVTPTDIREIHVPKPKPIDDESSTERQGIKISAKDIVNRLPERVAKMLPESEIPSEGDISDYLRHREKMPAEAPAAATSGEDFTNAARAREILNQLIGDTAAMSEKTPVVLAQEFLAAHNRGDENTKRAIRQALQERDAGSALRGLDEAEVQSMQPQVAEGTYELPMLPFNSGNKYLPDGSMVTESPTALPQITPPKAERITLKSGKPFANEKTAKAYQTKNNLQESHQVKPVEGGFVLDPIKVRKVETAKLEPNAAGVQIVDKSGQVPSTKKLVAAGDASRIEKKLPAPANDVTPIPTMPKVTQEKPDVKSEPKSNISEKKDVTKSAYKPVEEMSDEEWLAGARFYRSGKIKSAQLPNGKRVILSPGSTQTNFRENDRDFLLGLKPKAKTAQPTAKQPEPAAAQKPAEPGKQPASNSQYSVVQMSDGKFKILKPDGKGYAIGTSREWAEEIAAGMNKSLVPAKTVTKSAYKTEPFQGGFRVLDPQGKQYSWHTSKQAADDKAAELNNKAVNIPPVLYHGTDSNFSEFDPAKGSNGFWFSENPSDAGDYGNNVLQASITIQNPAYFKRTNGDKGVNEAIAKAKADGYDGLIVTSPEDGDESGMFWPTNYVAFYPEQIKLIEKKGESEEVIKAPATESQKSEYTEQTRTIAEIVQTKFAAGEGLKITDLINYANEVFGGTQADGVWNIKDLYDSMELGINLYLLNNQEMVNLFNSGDIKAFVEKVKTEILAKIPTQTRRTEEMDEFQQFSTPPSIASMAAWLANINKNDSVLEPSAGIGGLAVFGKMAGAEVIVNELSKRRADILANMPFNRFFSENGEQLNNILPDDVAPTVVIMNPPFSSTAGRVQGERKTKNGGAHVEQALKRLQPGGRLIAIVGQGMSFEHKTFADWWGKIKKEYNVLANVGLSGQEYKKYGTTFDNRILVIDKTGATTGQPVSGDYNNIESMIDALQGVRNVRQAISSGAETSSADANKPGGRKTSRGGGGGRSSRRHSNTGLRTDQSSSQDNAASRPEENTSTDERIGLSDSSGVDDNNETASNNETVRPDGDEQGRSERDNGKNTAGNDKSSASESLRNDGSEQLEISQTERTDKGELSDSIYDEYRPSVTIAGAKRHPGKLVESAAMAAVSPAKVNYTPKIPSEIVRSGKISDAQLEAVIRAGNNHNQKLLDGKRKGFFIGDGTGVGKGREISAVFWDNFLQGRKKGVWVTKNSDLFKDARRDIEGIGWDKSVAFELKDYDDIKQSEGVLLISYDTLKGKSKDGRTRLEQINSWLGENFDGVIAFDEAHMMANSVTTQSSRGKQKPSERALKGFDFRQQNPDARVVYVSATGATEPSNLGYLERLGLWGAGTPFGSVDAFIAEVTSGGVAAMEMIAADMKAMGNYIARSLSFDGVTYGRLEHGLSPEQQKVYGTYCSAWQTVLRNIAEALEVSGGKNSRQARSVALSAFWSANQRFFNQVLTSLQMPTLLKDIEQQLKDGKSVILQLTNTNEAQLKRQLDNLEDGALEDLDLTPTEIISQFVESSFPVAQMEEYTDENGNKRYRVVIDSNGNVVLNKDAVAMRDKLLDELGSIRRIDGPLDMIINHFGPDAVAEITGRTTRVVWRDGEDGGKVRVKENRSKRHSEAEENDFMSGKKRILVFSEAGGTGRSFHADLSKKNQQHRIHYLVQAGWKADAAIQGLGRSHRTNEASQPHYVLCSTNVPAQVRFTSTIARRLDQLGALTRGQRQAGSQGIFQAKDNLENEYAAQAVHGFIRDLASQGSIGGLTFSEFELQSGLNLRDQLGIVSMAAVEEIPVRQFLNRTLSFDLPTQELVYSEIFTRLDELVRIAENNGTLDVGMETIRAKSIVEKRSEVVRVDEDSGAKTEYHLLEGEHDAKYNNFPGEVGKSVSRGYFLNEKTGRLISIVSDPRTRSTDGELNSTFYAAMTPNSYGEVAETTLQKSYTKVSTAEAERLWNEQLRELPKTYKTPIHLITGTLLPVWDRLSKGNVKIVRAQTDNGKVYLGRTIPAKSIDKVLENLGVGVNTYSAKDAVSAILDNGDEAELANGWKLKRKRVAGENRIEIIGPDISNREELDLAGVFAERIQYQTRFFIPKDKAVEVIETLIKNRPITSLGTPKQSSEPLYSIEYLAGRLAKKGLKQAGRVVRKGLELLRSGLNAFATWAREMSKQFGKAIHKHLKAMYADLQAFNKQLGRTGAISGRPGGLKNSEVGQSSLVAGKAAQEMLTDKWAKKGLARAYRYGADLYNDGENVFAEWQKYMQQRFKGIDAGELTGLWNDIKNPELALKIPLRDSSTKNDTPSDQNVKPNKPADKSPTELKQMVNARNLVWKRVDKDTYELELTDPNTGKTSVVETLRRPKGSDSIWNVDNWTTFDNKGTSSGSFTNLKVAKAAIKAHARDAFNQKTYRDNAVIKDRQRDEEQKKKLEKERRRGIEQDKKRDEREAERRKRGLEQDKKRDEREAAQQEKRKKKAEEFIAKGKKKKIPEAAKPKTWRDQARRFIEKAEEVLFDAWAPVRRLQETIKKAAGVSELPESMDLYQKLEVVAGKVEAGTRIFKDKYFNQIKDYLVKNNINYNEANRFLAIMHAKERNDAIAERNPAFALTGAPGSGIETETARKEIAEHKKNGTYEKLLKFAEMTYRLNNALLDEQVRYGLLSQKQRDAYRRYTNYTPMKSPPDQGFVLDRTAFGRRSEATDQLAYIEKAIDVVYKRGERKQVINTALNLFSKYTNPKLYREYEPDQVQYYDKRTGKVRLRTDTSKLYNNPAVIWSRDVNSGELKAFEIKDTGLQNALNRQYSDLGVEQKAFRYFAGINRWLAGVSTAYNPEFIFTNLLRDVQQGAASVGVNLPEGSVKKFVENLGRAKRAISDTRAGKVTADTRLLEEFQLAGGKTGYSELSRLEDTARNLEREISEAQTGGRWYDTKQSLVKVRDWIADWNDAIETRTRFAGYLTAKEAGFSTQKSAAFAKGMTINFNKKGTWAPVFNSLYLFSSASLGGSFVTANIIGKAAKTPKGRAMIAGAIGLGFVMELLNRAVAGDDDDEGVNYYDKVPDYIKDSNYVFMVPGTKGKYFAIPMPYGLNVLPSIGRNMAASMFGVQSFKAGAANVVGAVLNSFNPIGGDNRGFGYQLVPTAARPFIDIATNSSWTGRKIRPDQPAFGELARSELYFDQESKVLIKATKLLNELTGGDRYTDGFASFLSPAEVSHLLESYTGGVGRTISRGLDTATRLITGEAPELDNVPVVRRFGGGATDYNTYETFRENLKMISDFKRAKREKDTNWIKKNKWLIRAEKLHGQLEKQLVAIRKNTSPSAVEARNRETKAKKQFNKQFSEMKQKALSKN